MSYFSFVQYAGDGVTKTFAVPFPYLDRAHVVVKVDAVPVAFSWLDDGTIQTDVAPPNGSVIDIRRETPRGSRMVDFVDGSVLTEADLDLNALQTFYIVQEAIDIAGGTLGITDDGSFDATFRRLSNLGSPVDPHDAVTKQWAETAMSSQLAQAMSARSAARTSETNAKTSEINAAASASTASSKASEAATSEANAANSASSAASSASTATAKAAEAATAATAATNAKTTAEAARDKAGKWADEAEDVAVETGKFSARHWAAKAAAWASSIFMPSIVGNAGKFLRAKADESGLEYVPLDAFKPGMIIMWGKPISEIPEGWALCDGKNGTPNLTDRFIIGAGGSYALGATGGASSVTVSGGTHTHTGSVTVNPTTLTTSHMPSHRHRQRGNSTGGSTILVNAYGLGGDRATDTYTDNVGGGQSHGHTASLSLNSGQGGHTHTVPTMPPYYALVFIMKL